MVLNSPFTKTLYIDLLSLLLWSSLSELSPDLQSSFCPQIKLNSQLSRCASFLVDKGKSHLSPCIQTVLIVCMLGYSVVSDFL